MSEPIEIYNNGALKIVHNPIPSVGFGLYFNVGDVKINFFLTEEQAILMNAAIENQ